MCLTAAAAALSGGAALPEEQEGKALLLGAYPSRAIHSSNICQHAPHTTRADAGRYWRVVLPTALALLLCNMVRASQRGACPCCLHTFCRHSTPIRGRSGKQFPTLQSAVWKA